MLICKSGNLLSTWGETSDESSVPDRKVFALCLFGVSAFGSRHFLFMECARCGTVQAAGIWILNIHFDFWSDRSWRHSACYAGKLNVPHQNPSKSDILLPNEFAYIINQPQYLIRPLQHLSQWCSDFSISFHSGLPAASRWGEWEEFGHSGGRCFFVLSLCDMDGEICKGCNPYDSLDSLDESIRKTRIWRIDLFL